MNATPPDETGRLRTKQGAAAYLGTSEDTVDRLIQAGQLPIVRLPVEHPRGHGPPRVGACRRVLIDVRDLDALVDRSKEVRGQGPLAVPALAWTQPRTLTKP